MVTVTAQIKQFYFDREKVIAQIGRQRARKMGRIGSFVRTRARSLLRRRKKSSEPGRPPSVRSKSKRATLRDIRFGLTMDGYGVVIGPAFFHSISGGTAKTVPELMEKGGSARITAFGGGDKLSFWEFPSAERRDINAHYEPRPFMGPALEMETEKGTLADAWAA